MASEGAKELRQQGIALAKAGQKDEARRLLQQSLRIEPANEAAWLWLASVARDNREKIFCLDKVLEINPRSEAALKAMEVAQSATPAQPTVEPIRVASPASVRKLSGAPNTAPPPPVKRASTQDLLNQQPGVPMPSAEAVAEAQKAADLTVRKYLAPAPDPVKWVHKTRRRAGEGDIVRYRLLLVAATAGAFVLFLIVGTIVVLTNDDLRSIVIAPTATSTSTPTTTPTNTPGLTPTPSPQPRVSPTPTAPVPPNIPQADIYNLPPPTAIYPAVLEVPLENAIVEIDRGNFAVALPMIETERESLARFNPNPYYYEAVAYLGQGDSDSALDTLEEAAQRAADEAPNENYMPLINSGLAQVYVQIGLEAQAGGRAAAAETAFESLQTVAEAAIERDPRLAPPYLALARRYTADRDYREALAIIDTALEVDALSSNIDLILEKGEIYLAQREYDLAEYQAFLALYINPATERAYDLQIRAALAEDKPGQAVLYAQNYLFYYPGSTRAFQLFGDARVAEGNPELAILVYSQGLAGEDITPQTVSMLLARGNLYAEQRRYTDAYDDFTRAYNLSDDPVVQAQRMIAAYNAGRYSDAQDDANDLVGREIIPESVLSLLRARILIDMAEEEGDTSTPPYQQALGLLIPLIGADGITPDQIPTIQEYTARAHFSLGSNEAALNAINAALSTEETGARRFLRGRINELQEEFVEAARDYEWVLAWSEIYSYAYRGDVEERLADIASELPT